MVLCQYLSLSQHPWQYIHQGVGTFLSFQTQLSDTVASILKKILRASVAIDVSGSYINDD